MKNGIQIGKIKGIPVLIDTSWIFIAVVLTLSFQKFYEDTVSSYSLLLGIVIALLYFGSILLHELAHSLVAQQEGIKVNFVTLHFFGGLAALEREPSTPLAEAKVAVAGPLMNFALALISFGGLYLLLGNDLPRMDNPEFLRLLLQESSQLKVAMAIVCYRLAYLNLFVGMLNLLPGLPLDGGRILRASLWQFSRSRYRGTISAARSGQIMGWMLVVYGVFTALDVNLVTGLFFALTGGMFLSEATQTIRLAEIQEALLKINAESTMTRDFRLVDADMTLRHFADNFLLMETKGTTPIYFASGDGRDRGWVNPQKLRQIPNDRWEKELLTAITDPMKSLPGVQLSSCLAQIITTLETQKIRWVAVFSPVGSVAGVVDRGDVLRALGKVLRWNLPEEFIQKVKNEGAFPPMLPFAELSAQVQEK